MPATAGVVGWIGCRSLRSLPDWPPSGCSARTGSPGWTDCRVEHRTCSPSGSSPRWRHPCTGSARSCCPWSTTTAEGPRSRSPSTAMTSPSTRAWCCSGGRGEGAVRLQRADPHRRALLLDWLPGGDLRDTWDIEACEVVGGLYARLHVPALPQLRTVASYVEGWLADLADLGHEVPVPRRYVEQALSLGRDLVAPDAGADVVVHGDLHYANVLADVEGRWVAIDPKPMSGDPHYEPAPMLWNRMDELAGHRRVGPRRPATPLPHPRGRRRSRRGARPRLGRRADGRSTPAGRCRTRAAPAGTSRRGTGLGHPLHRDHQGRPGLRTARHLGGHSVATHR